MKKAVTKYTIVCDNCRKDIFTDNEEFDCSDENFLNDEIEMREWVTCENGPNSDQHFCTDCFTLIKGELYVNRSRTLW